MSEREVPAIDDCEFVECDSCRQKPGTPILCEGCLRNRERMTKMRNEINQLRSRDSEAISDAAGLCESESNRMRHDPKTSEHWKQVAATIRKSMAHAARVELSGERVSSETMQQRLRSPAEPAAVADGRELPDEPGVWERTHGICDEYEIIVRRFGEQIEVATGVSTPAFLYTGWCGRERVKGNVDQLPRGGWRKAGMDSERPLNINDPIPDLLFRKAGLTQEQAVRCGELLRSEECGESAITAMDRLALVPKKRTDKRGTDGR